MRIVRETFQTFYECWTNRGKVQNWMQYARKACLQSTQLHLMKSRARVLVKLLAYITPKAHEIYNFKDEYEKYFLQSRLFKFTLKY